MGDMDARRSEEPQDEITRIADRMLSAVADEPELQAVVMLSRGDRHGTALQNYDHDFDAALAMLMHVKAIFETHGIGVHFVEMEGALADMVREAERDG